MNEEKQLHIVLAHPNAIDADELRRMKAAIEKLTGQEAKNICPLEKNLLILVFAEHSKLVRAMDDAKAIGTQVFISALASPYTTIGFGPALASLQKYLH